MDDEKENKIKHWQYAYDKAFTFHQINIESYFKRTQILMFTIQAGLATAFIKFLSNVFSNTQNSVSTLYLALIIISSLGIVFCFIWLSMIERQWNTLEHCRCHMRYIESHLINLGVPLALFRSGAAIFFHHSCVIFGNDKKCENCKSKLCQKRFPYEEDKKSKIGLMDLEKHIVFIFGFIWAVCFSIFLYQILILKKYNTKILDYILYFYFTVIAIMLVVYMIFKLRKQVKDNKKYCWAWNIRFSILLFLSYILAWIPKYHRNIILEILLSVYLVISIIYTILDWEKDNNEKRDKKDKNKQFILFENLKEDLVKCPQKDD
jgi:hypothetical protein